MQKKNKKRTKMKIEYIKVPVSKYFDLIKHIFLEI